LNIPALILTSTNLIRIFTTGPEFVRENPNNFHCNQQDVIQKAVEKTRHQAKERMLVEGLSQLSTPRKSTSTLEALVDSIPIELNTIQTRASESAFALIECTATFEFTIPPQAMNAISKDQSSRDAATRRYAQLTNRGVSLDNFSFGVEFEQGKPTIVDLSDQQIPQILLSSITMAVADSDAILARRLAVVSADFYLADQDLNSAWKALAPHQRLRMRRSQREWISEKTRLCGDIEGERYGALSIADRIDALSCHGEMTAARLSILHD
jgi:uncharacterized protein YecT (DUF1311 family)